MSKPEYDFSEAETFERQLAESPVWQKFETILSEAHESVYHVPKNFPPHSKSRRRWGFLISVCASLLLIPVLVLLHFYSTESDLLNEEDFAEEELNWEEGEAELEEFDQLLNRVADEDGSIDLEFAILEDAVNTWTLEDEEIF